MSNGKTQQETHRVAFFHIRPRNNGVPSDKGGYTVAYKLRPDGKYSISICQCNTNQRYDEKLGEKVSEQRIGRGQFFVQSKQDFVQTIDTLNNKLSTGKRIRINEDAATVAA